MAKEKLPKWYARLSNKHGKYMDAVQELGKAVREAGPNAGAKLHQQAGAKMHQGLALACHRWPLAPRMADLLGGAERSSPEAA